MKVVIPGGTGQVGTILARHFHGNANEVVVLSRSDRSLPWRSEAVPGAEAKIAFDKFHVATHLGKAVDEVRRQENRALREQGDETLKGTKHLWLYHPERLPEKHQERLDRLATKALKTSRAWMLKELAMEMWESASRQEALEIFQGWYSWAIRSRLEPVKRVARMLKAHLQGVLNAIVARVTNARLEGLATRIQWLKRSARGYRNRQRFRTAIYFHCWSATATWKTFFARSTAIVVCFMWTPPL